MDFEKNYHEAEYRKLVLQELKDLNEDNKEIKKSMGLILDRMTILETVVMGVNKSNGLAGSLKKIENFIENTKPIIDKIHNDIYDPNVGIHEQIKCIKKERKEDKEAINILKNFKIRIYAITATAYALISAFVYLVNKFNLFGGK